MNKEIILKWSLRAYTFSLTEYNKAMGKFKQWMRTLEPEKTRYIA